MVHGDFVGISVGVPDLWEICGDARAASQWLGGRARGRRRWCRRTCGRSRAGHTGLLTVRSSGTASRDQRRCPTATRSRDSALTQAAGISLAAPRSSTNFGTRSGFLRMYPAKAGFAGRWNCGADQTLSGLVSFGQRTAGSTDRTMLYVRHHSVMLRSRPASAQNRQVSMPRSRKSAIMIRGRLPLCSG